MMMMKSVDEAEVTMRQIDEFIIDLQAPYRDDNTTVVMTTLCHCGSNSSDCHLLNDYNVTPVEHCNVHQQTIIQVVTQPYRINCLCRCNRCRLQSSVRHSKDITI